MFGPSYLEPPSPGFKASQVHKSMIHVYDVLNPKNKIKFPPSSIYKVGIVFKTGLATQYS